MTRAAAIATHIEPPWTCHLEHGEAGLRATFRRDNTLCLNSAAPYGANATWLAHALVGLKGRLAKSEKRRAEREARRIAAMAAARVAAE